MEPQLTRDQMDAARKQLSREEIESQFLEGVKDSAMILAEITQYCEDPKELVPILDLAAENRTLLRMIEKLIFLKKR